MGHRKFALKADIGQQTRRSKQSPIKQGNMVETVCDRWAETTNKMDTALPHRTIAYATASMTVFQGC